MPSTRKDYRWGILGHSQLGASHVRQALPNQDAIQFFTQPDGSPPAVMAVADGHGSAKSFRSDVGAQLAVESALQVCREFLDGIGDAAPSAVKNAAEQQIPPRIFQMWKRRVADHFARHPFSEAEIDRLGQQAGTLARDLAIRGDQPHLAYGSTLLAALLTKDYLICFQLGDGEILAVSDVTGEVGRAIPKDESLIANETTSLCQDDAVKYVRCRFQLFQDSPPGLVLLSTDGYPNSFVSPDDFLKIGSDYLDLLCTDGPDAVQKSLPGWLEQASRDGSGDDITLGIIYRREPPLVHPAVQPQDITAPPTVNREEGCEGTGGAAATEKPPIAQCAAASASMQADAPLESDLAPSQSAHPPDGADDEPEQHKSLQSREEDDVKPELNLTDRGNWRRFLTSVAFWRKANE